MRSIMVMKRNCVDKQNREESSERKFIFCIKLKTPSESKNLLLQIGSLLVSFLFGLLCAQIL